MAYSNIVHDCPFYCAQTACAVNSAGILFVANVINPPDIVKDNIPDTQYLVITRIDPATKYNQEVKRIYARDSYQFIVLEGASPYSDTGKYGGVAIAINGNDLYLVQEIRYEGVNKPRWSVFRGLAV